MCVCLCTHAVHIFMHMRICLLAYSHVETWSWLRESFSSTLPPCIFETEFSISLSGQWGGRICRIPVPSTGILECDSVPGLLHACRVSQRRSSCAQSRDFYLVSYFLNTQGITPNSPHLFGFGSSAMQFWSDEESYSCGRVRSLFQFG